jgi:CDP-paratose 2-epimerase
MSEKSSNRAVLIFGGAGFVGSNWAHHLLANTDAKIHVFDNLSRKRVQHNLEWLQRVAKATDRLKVTVADIRDAAAVSRVVCEATEIYHFAAQVAVTTSLDDPRNDFQVNAGGTLNILEAARQCGNRPFLLFTSTNKVYGHIAAPHKEVASATRHRCSASDSISEAQPLDFYSPYGCSKGTADQYVHDYARIYGLRTVVFRMSCIAGPRQFGNEDQGWVAHFVYSALQDKIVSIYGDGRQVRDVLAVQDLLRAFAAAHANQEKTAGQVYNIGGGSGNTISLLELMELIQQTLHVRLKHRFRPPRPGDQPVYVTDFRKFHSHAHWTPEIGIDRIVRDISRWYRNNEALFVPAPFAVPAAGKLQSGVLREIAS